MRITLYLILSVVLLSCNTSENKGNKPFQSSWQFSLSADSSAINPSYNDEAWSVVNIPHDWSIEFPFDTINGEGCTGYLPGGIGWYRKTFDADPAKNTFILFDGVYNNATIWCNGIKLGFHAYGYSPFYYNLKSHLNENGKENVITVKVDRTRYADSRWYTGSGIYRNVDLIIKEDVFIPIWGTFVTTPEVDKDKALVSVETQVKNTSISEMNAKIVTKVKDKIGTIITTSEKKVTIAANKQAKINQLLNVKQPLLWDVNAPNLYKAVTTVFVDDKQVDQQQTTFGIRYFRFDANTGFSLNGKSMKIKGVCLHHDAGLVGAAVPKVVWKRRFKILKEAGVNAIRVSHNPASDEFLALCDEMGILVQDEFFDEWDYPKDKRLNMNERHNDYISRGYTEHFQTDAEKDLKSTILAHRNHPSIFQWSIGNEIEWTYPRNKKATGFWDASWSGNYFWSPTPLSPQEIKVRYDKLDTLEHNIGRTAQKLAKWTKELDVTRPVVANCILPSASYASGYAEALDVIGFSYRRVMYDYGHKHFPNLPIMGTENVAQWHEWKAIEERDFVAGTFLWTGIHYMGEVHQRNPKAARKRGIDCGIIDFAGFKTPSYYMMKSLWNEKEPTLYLSTNIVDKSQYKLDSKTNKIVEKKKGAWEKRLWVWYNVNNHWNYKENEKVIIEAISNCPELELFVNNKSYGVKKLNDFEDHIYKWMVPYTDGTVEVKGMFNGKMVKQTLATAGKATQFKLSIDNVTLSKANSGIAHIEVQLTDENDVPVGFDDQEITVALSGDAKLLGVDNGNAYSLQTYQTNKVFTSKGKALIVIQATSCTAAEASLEVSLGEFKTTKVFTIK